MVIIGKGGLSNRFRFPALISTILLIVGLAHSVLSNSSLVPLVILRAVQVEKTNGVLVQWCSAGYTPLRGRSHVSVSPNRFSPGLLGAPDDQRLPGAIPEWNAGSIV